MKRDCQVNRGQLRYVPFATINGSICYPFLFFFLQAIFVLCKKNSFPCHVWLHLHPFAVCLLLWGCYTWAHRTFYTETIYNMIVAILKKQDDLQDNNCKSEINTSLFIACCDWNLTAPLNTWVIMFALFFFGVCAGAGQAARCQGGWPAETGCFLQRTGGPAGGEGEFTPGTQQRSPH